MKKKFKPSKELIDEAIEISQQLNGIYNRNDRNRLNTFVLFNELYSVLIRAHKWSDKQMEEYERFIK